MIKGPELLQRIRHSGSRGVLVSVWATWCAPCRAELPFLQSLSAQLAPLAVQIWLLSIDDAYALPVARALLDTSHIDLPRMAAAPPLEAFAAALSPNWPRGTIPASFLFNEHGKLVHFWTGELPASELAAAVAELGR